MRDAHRSPPASRRGSAAVALLLFGLCCLPTAGASAFSGEIASDTIWEGTVEVTGETIVAKGVTLLIQPGTVVRFAPGKDEAGQFLTRLTVHGVLVAQGTAEKPILFTSASATPQSPEWGGIRLEEAAERPNRISHATIRYALTGIAGAGSTLAAEDLEIRDCTRGITALREFGGSLRRGTIVGNEFGLFYEQSSGLSVEDSLISGNSGGGVICSSSSSPTIRFNTITGNGGIGVSCFRGSSPLIEGNTIRGHEKGINVELQSRPRILRNAIRENETGIWGFKLVFPLIQGNTITENGTGVFCNRSAYPEIHGNNIFANRTFGVVLGDNMSILMEKKIPYRKMGRAFFDGPPEGEILPPQSRRFDQFAASDEGIVDARGNWWGASATEEMAKLPADGNSSVIEDFYDKPDTFFGEEKYRRDRVVFTPWEKELLKDAGPPPKSTTGFRGRVLSGGKPVAGVRVHAYPDAAGGFRGEGAAYSSPTAADGSFSLALGSGTWYLVAKGPLPPFPNTEPGAGALSGAFSGNPITLGAGSVATVDILANKLE